MNRLFYLLFALVFSNALSAQAPACCNILTNGDFEDGNVGFTSDLPQNCGCAATSYCVSTNFQDKCAGWQNVNDHTSGAGNFLIIDGDDSSPVPVDVWQISTMITNGVTYCFSFWVASQYDSPFDLGLAVNGTPVPGAVFTVQQGTASWTQYTFSWTASGSGTNISIQQLLAGSFQDFGIDDIEFGQELTANFSYSPDISCGMNVSFFNQSTGPAPLSYSWNFDDSNSPGNISNLPNPIHKFTDCGTYDVCLTVSRGSCSQTYCETILVEDTDPPTALCLGVGVTLNANCMATVTPALINAGSFDNCYIASMSVNPKVILGCGLHPVTLTVIDSCGNSSNCTVDVQAFEAVPPVITCPSNVSVNAIPTMCSILVNGIKWLTATDNCGIPTVNYVVTGATPKSGPNDVSGTVFNQGQSVVTYTATDGCGNSATCSFQVVVSCEKENCACPAGGAAGANLIANGNFSSGPSGFGSGLVLNPTCGAGFYNVDKSFHLFCPPWDTLPDHTNDVQKKYLILDGADNGNTPTDLWTSNVVITANTNYCFSFWWASAYANADFNFDIEAYIRVGTTDYVLGTTQIVQNTIAWTLASYTWNSTAFPLVVGPQVLRIRQVSGDDHRDFGIDDICFTKAIPPPVCSADFDVIYNGCSKFTFNGFALIGTPPFNYAWNFGDNSGIVSGPNSSVMHTYTVAGPYTITLVVTDAAGCTASQTVMINVPPLFAISITGNTNICAGDCATLTANGAGIVSCQWSTNQGSQPTVQVCPGSTTTYFVTCTDANGCTATSSVTVNVLVCDCGPGDLLNNGTFVFGITPGNLGGPGNAPPWSPIYSPQVVTTDGCVQQGCMQMWGNQVVGEGIEQPMVIQPGCTYQITFCAKRLPVNNPSGSFNPQLRFRATTVTGVVTYGSYGTLGANSVLIGNSPNLTTNWLPYTINWTAPSGGPALSNFVVTVWNDNAALNPAQTSWVRVDSICVFKMDCPPEIACGPFSHTGFGYEKGPFIPASCGNTSPVVVQCPNPNQNFYFTGAFNCIGGTISTAPVTWELWKNNLFTGVSGSTVATPYFGFQLYPSYFTTGGVYELRIKGHCGNNVCDCSIKFEIQPCPDTCSCDNIESDVAGGFYQTFWSKSCRMCFTPIGLEDCDRVQWSIEPTDTSYVNPIGYSNGKKSFCYSFASGGIKTITMRVIRLRPDETTCEAVFYKKIFVKCDGVPDCENEVLLNPEFGAGPVGPLGSGGNSDDWVKVSGNPEVVDTSFVGGDDWSIQLSGNDNSYDAITTEKGYCLEKDTGTITLRTRHDTVKNSIGNIRGAMLFINLVRGDSFPTWPCEGDNCYEIACLQFPEGPDEWAEFQFDYDLRDLNVSDDCSSASAPTVRLRPVIYIGNWLHDAQGGDSSYSQVLIDNICLNGKGLVPTHTPTERASFRIFPNPNPGTFTIELPKAATPGMAFRIVGITGQVLRNQSTQTGSAMQTVQAGDLPAGLYFLQVVSDGKVLALEKFVKQ